MKVFSRKSTKTLRLEEVVNGRAGYSPWENNMFILRKEHEGIT